MKNKNAKKKDINVMLMIGEVERNTQGERMYLINGDQAEVKQRR